jgi:hypothetical protein
MIKLISIILISFLPLTAQATFDTWDSAPPWGASAPTYYLSWNVFDTASFDNSPDGGISTGAFSVLQPNSTLYGNGNVSVPITSNITLPLYSASIDTPNPSGSFYDVYVLMENYKTNALTDATLYYSDPVSQTSIGISGSSTTTFTNPNFLENELYWVFSNVPSSSNYIINVSSAGASNGSHQVSLFGIAAVAAVPEPETYALFLTGLLLMGLVSRKRVKGEPKQVL